MRHFCSLSDVAKEELIWWKDHLMKWNGKRLVSRKPDFSTESDMSLLGWEHLVSEFTWENHGLWRKRCTTSIA